MSKKTTKPEDQKNEIPSMDDAEIAPAEVEEMEHIVTEKDMKNNPDLEKEGVKIGDKILVPKEKEEEEEEEEDSKEDAKKKADAKKKEDAKKKQEKAKEDSEAIAGIEQKNDSAKKYVLKSNVLYDGGKIMKAGTIIGKSNPMYGRLMELNLLK